MPAPVDYKTAFKMPTPMKITGRGSSITNAFISSIIPVIPPTEGEIKESLSILEMTPETLTCSYCGDGASEWDHLRPLVKNKRPSGYISEIRNLVPACGKCNQSKGNKDWRAWMESDARLSPKSKGIADLHERIERLNAYEQWGNPIKLDFEALVRRDIWVKHWKNCEGVFNLMRDSQALADEIRDSIASQRSASQ